LGQVNVSKVKLICPRSKVKMCQSNIQRLNQVDLDKKLRWLNFSI